MHSSFPEAVRSQSSSPTANDLIVCFKAESTTIALLARLAGLLEPLAQFLKTKPVWGTCAGAILLSSAVENAKKGGQEVLGGVSVKIARNGWGSQVRFLSVDLLSLVNFTQVESFEVPLEVEGLRESNRAFHGIFIRAPVSTLVVTPVSIPLIQ